MSNKLKQVVIVRTSVAKWGKGKTLSDALKAADFDEKRHSANITRKVYSDEMSDVDHNEIVKCWNVTQFGNIQFADDATVVDRIQHDNHFLGEIVDEFLIDNIKS